MADKITPKELQEKILKEGKYIIIDVRESDEVEVKEADGGDSKIFGAVNIPLEQLVKNSRNGDLDDFRLVTIYTYSLDGYRENIAADELNKQGFNAINIEGGFFAWKDEKQRKKNAEQHKSNSE
jgi:rhodanese-related sulfurtransferase